MVESSSADILRSVFPFKLLPQELLHNLAKVAELNQFRGGDIVYEQGSKKTDRVYILNLGMAESIKVQTGERVQLIEEGHYFGEFEVVFDSPRITTVRMLRDSQVLCIPSDRFVELFHLSTVFAQAFGTIFKDKQGIFRYFDSFKAEMLRFVSSGHIHLASLITHYKALEPILHPLVNEKDRIDTASLNYVIRRLPNNISTVFALLFRDELPSVFDQADQLFTVVSSDARRRAVWEIVPGKNLILLRSGISDLFDFITCLCLYVVEVKKIRSKLYNSNALNQLRHWKDETNDGQALFELLEELGFSQDESRGLFAIWGGKTAQTLYNLVLHREMFTIDVRRQQVSYNSKRSELWTSQIAEAITAIYGTRPASLPEDVDVHIISSNTHSVINCLHPWYRVHSDQIIEWARERRAPELSQQWRSEADMVYAMAPRIFREAKELYADYKQLTPGAITRLGKTASTGIDVQLIRTENLDFNFIDPGLSYNNSDTPRLIVNVDYAFGEQAEYILRNLMMLLGPQIRSVNFLGKAGGLVGRRGDVLIASSFIDHSTDVYQRVPQLGPHARAILSEAVGEDRIHHGPMVTVEGTLLQNYWMLMYYKRIWDAVGLEMEGAHYYRQVVQGLETGVLKEPFATRSIYYTSDIPLNSEENLSESLGKHEGVPPLYGGTRAVLSEILRS